MNKSKLIWAALFAALLFFSFRKGTQPYLFPKPALFPQMPVAADNPVTVEGATLGRFLFYDPVLSSDSSLSCSGCHNQKYAFSDAPIAFSKGVNGKIQTRNTMPLFNLAWHPAFFYDGRVNTLEDQVSHPIRAVNEMNMDWSVLLQKLNSSKFYSGKFKNVFNSNTVDSIQVKKALAQFLRTLISYQSDFDKVLSGKRKFSEEERKGLFVLSSQTRGDCMHCHPADGNALVTTFSYSNNGLDSVYDSKGYKDKGRGGVTGIDKDNGKFMVPSLRNILLTPPYMHDGRFKTIEEVLDFYSTGVHQSANIDSKMGFAHQKGVRLSEEEKKDVIAFLKTLTDSVFITKKEFGDPFKK